MIPWALLAALLFPGGDAQVDSLRHPAPAYVAPVKTIPLPLITTDPNILDSWTWGPAPR